MIARFLASNRNRSKLTSIPLVVFSMIYLTILAISPINQFGSYFIDGDKLTYLSYVMIPLFVWIVMWCVIFLIFDIYLYRKRRVYCNNQT